MTQPKDSSSRLFTSLRLLFRPNNQLGGIGVPPFTDVADQSEPPEINPQPPISAAALPEHLFDLVLHLHPSLPTSCRWLEQGALEVVGEFPVDAGGIADIWAGMMDNRKVAIKVYRFCSSSDWLPNCTVSRTYLWHPPC